MLINSSKKCAGFSLLELLFSILLCALLCCVLFKFYPLLFTASKNVKTQQQLTLEAEALLEKITKDLYRVGFSAQDPTELTEPVLTLSNSCLIILYDLDRNGTIHLGAENADSDRFAYRFQNNNLEYKRGASTCTGSNWYKLNDPEQFTVIDFEILNRAQSYQIVLTLKTVKNPILQDTFSIFIRKYHEI